MTWDELKKISASKPETRESQSKQQDTCAGKRAFHSREEAMAVLMHVKHHSKKHRGRYVSQWQRQIPYKCEICGKYHLTKQR